VSSVLISVFLTVAAIAATTPEEKKDGEKPPVTATQPYGFPATGHISSLDKNPCDNGCHFGTFLPSRSPVSGGIDISRNAGQEAKSTVVGTVTMARFDTGCSSGQSGICYGALGGTVYIQSDDGHYKVAYLHLADSLRVKENDHVDRGTVLGVINPEYYPPETGPHIHYQILKDGSNANFADTSNQGKCLEGKIVPDMPQLDGEQNQPTPLACD
jgi:murein DD-endopeptidase MepM/ murein hydrolase activator NlpD